MEADAAVETVIPALVAGIQGSTDARAASLDL
jgi:hypothetical protein